ncbi:hypothetical protein AOLI_G00291150 [Acnodon oligacanthus]
MSMEDPFFVVKGEVQKALSRARGLFQRWEELLQEDTPISRDELDWSTNELRNCLRAIDWDLEDLHETISIVESNPGKFRLGENELQERREFVERTRTAVQEMKEQLSSPSALAQAEKKSRQALMGGTTQVRHAGLEPHLVSANSRYIQEQQEQQQLIVQEQDEQLELVSGSIRVLKDMSSRIGDELDEQAVMLGEFSEEMEQTSSRMDSVLKKLEKVSHMTSRGIKKFPLACFSQAAERAVDSDSLWPSAGRSMPYAVWLYLTVSLICAVKGNSSVLSLISACRVRSHRERMTSHRTHFNIRHFDPAGYYCEALRRGLGCCRKRTLTFLLWLARMSFRSSNGSQQAVMGSQRSGVKGCSVLLAARRTDWSDCESV